MIPKNVRSCAMCGDIIDDSDCYYFITKMRAYGAGEDDNDWEYPRNICFRCECDKLRFIDIG